MCKSNRMLHAGQMQAVQQRPAETLWHAQEHIRLIAKVEEYRPAAFPVLVTQEVALAVGAGGVAGVGVVTGLRGGRVGRNGLYGM